MTSDRKVTSSTRNAAMITNPNTYGMCDFSDWLKSPIAAADPVVAKSTPGAFWNAAGASSLRTFSVAWTDTSSDPSPAAGRMIAVAFLLSLALCVARPVKSDGYFPADFSNFAIASAAGPFVTSSAPTATITGWFSAGNCFCIVSHVRTTAMSRDSDSVPGSAVCMPSTGSDSATRSPVAMTTDSFGLRSTLSVMRDQTAMRWTRRRRNLWPGMRPFSILSPNFESRAGRTVRDPRTATATTTIVAVANDSNIEMPAKYIPAIETITVKPEMSTARPDVAAAIPTAVLLS